jgi:hypothetical protein
VHDEHHLIYDAKDRPNSGVICPQSHVISRNRLNFPHPDRARHAAIANLVRDRRAHLSFGHLSLEAAREKLVAQALGPEHRSPREAAPVVPALPLPLFPAVGRNLFEEAIGKMGSDRNGTTLSAGKWGQTPMAR